MGIEFAHFSPDFRHLGPILAEGEIKTFSVFADFGYFPLKNAFARETPLKNTAFSWQGQVTPGYPAISRKKGGF